MWQVSCLWTAHGKPCPQHSIRDRILASHLAQAEERGLGRSHRHRLHSNRRHRGAAASALIAAPLPRPCLRTCMPYAAPVKHRPAVCHATISMQLRACYAVAFLVLVVIALKPIYGRQYTIPVDSGYGPWKTLATEAHTIAAVHPLHPQQQQATVRDPHPNPLLQQIQQHHQQLLVQSKINSHQSMSEAQQLQAQLMVRGLGVSPGPAMRTHTTTTAGATAAQTTGGGKPQAKQQTRPAKPRQQQPQQQEAASSAQGPATLETQQRRWPDGYLAVCVVVRDQTADIRYWLEYHKWLGVDKFYVFDHNSTTPVMPALFDHIQAGTVEYQYFVGHPRAKPWFSASNQFTAYQRCLMQHWRRHRWIAFLDADEFLVLHPGAASATSDARRTRRNHLGLFMADYEQDKLGALGVNWVLFGSSGLERRPEEGPLAAYTKCIPRAHDESRHVKVIVNTRYVLNMGGTPHEVQLRAGAQLVDEHQRPFTGPKTPSATWDKIVLHHYVLKSKEEFASKTARGSGAGNTKTREYWMYVENLASDTCGWGPAVSRRFMAAQPALTFCTDAFVQGYEVCPEGPSAAGAGAQDAADPDSSAAAGAGSGQGRLPQAHEAEEQRQRQMIAAGGEEEDEEGSRFAHNAAQDMAAAAATFHDDETNSGGSGTSSSSSDAGTGSTTTTSSSSSSTDSAGSGDSSSSSESGGTSSIGSSGVVPGGGGGVGRSLTPEQLKRRGYLMELLAGTDQAMAANGQHDKK